MSCKTWYNSNSFFDGSGLTDSIGPTGPTDANVPNRMVNGMGVRLMHFIQSYIDLLVHGVCEYDVDFLVEAAAGP